MKKIFKKIISIELIVLFFIISIVPSYAALNSDMIIWEEYWRKKNNVTRIEQAINRNFSYAKKEIEKKIINTNDIKIERIAGVDRFETAQKVAEKVMSLGGKTDRYGLVNGYKFPDAMAGGVLCGIEKMPMLLTDGRSIPNGYEHKKAIVFGGKEVVNIDESKILERFAGADRFETALKVARKLNKIKDKSSGKKGANLVDGFDFKGSMKAISNSIEHNRPLIFADTVRMEIPKSVVDFIKEFNELPFFVELDAGKFENFKNLIMDLRMEDLIEWAQAERITEEEYLKYRYPITTLFDLLNKEQETIIIVSSHDFADGLSASGLIGVLKNAGMVIVGKRIDVVQRCIIRNSNLKNVYIIGGEKAVSSKIERDVKNIILEMKGIDIAKNKKEAAKNKPLANSILNKLSRKEKISYYGWHLNQEQIEYADKRAREVINEIIEAEMTDIEKVEEITKWIYENTEPDSNQSNEIYKKTHADTSWAVFKKGKAACSGYVRAFKLLGAYAGLKVEIINEDKWKHQWNRIYLADEERWIEADAQINDIFKVHPINALE